jgi:hypothetical protein
MTARDEDWRLLGLEPGADIAHIKRAYRERRALYEPSALATYSLLDHEERSDMVDRIDAAYERLLAEPAPGAADGPPPTAPREAPPVGPAPDPHDHPGRFLNHQRLRAELSLEEISSATKIGTRLLEQIEDEEYGALPAPVFVRGHVQQLARAVGIDDPDGIARLYLDRMTGGDGEANGGR